MNRASTLFVMLSVNHETTVGREIAEAVMQVPGVYAVQPANGSVLEQDMLESGRCLSCGRPKCHPSDGDDLDRCAGVDFSSCQRFTAARERGRQDEKRRMRAAIRAMPVALTIHARPKTQEEHRNDGKYVEVGEVAWLIDYRPEFDE